MGSDKEQARIKEIIAKFPATFKLRNHEGTFRISERNSYFMGPGECQGELMLYTQRQWTEDKFKHYYGRSPNHPEDLWVDFAKGTENELQRNIVR